MKILISCGTGLIGSNLVEKLTKNVYSAFEGADALVLMTAHREFRKLDMRKAKERMRTPILMDGRRVFG